ncbi:MAG: hypothetical protein A2297_03875 [Elusimicrobia bacterium RIFOXYB2_FULL_48_7]|nr:MAG: hypothetical protein A2297_03875 [Elusimicrobia bacterium RIFOXYB2_FULL_48_7]
MRKHVFVLCCLVLSVGCARKAIIKPAALEPAVIKSDVKDGSEPSVRSAEWAAVPELKTIYFDYDKALLKPAARDRLVENSGYLKAHPELVVIIEGHCDERGTNEYNMGLGQQRAALVREYYGLLGIPLSQIATISYGEEKPANPGYTKDAWAKNRRAETKVKSK